MFSEWRVFSRNSQSVILENVTQINYSKIFWNPTEPYPKEESLVSTQAKGSLNWPTALYEL